MLLYLASPYSHSSLIVMEARFKDACSAAARLMERGYTVFSPIAHSHPIADHLRPDFRTNFDFWMKQDLPILKVSDALVVLKLDGWDKSRGVQAEIAYARANGIPIMFIMFDGHVTFVN